MVLKTSVLSIHLTRSEAKYFLATVSRSFWAVDSVLIFYTFNALTTSTFRCYAVVRQRPGLTGTIKLTPPAVTSVLFGSRPLWVWPRITPYLMMSYMEPELAPV